MNILMLSAEVAPFATVGGLSQVLYFLSKSLLKSGNDVRVFTPFHGKIKQKKFKTKSILTPFMVPTNGSYRNGPDRVECTLRLYKKIKPLTYFVENREYYTLRENVFGYADDHTRMYLMCLSCLEWLYLQHKNKDWMPDIIHVHDWHAGYFVELARTHRRYQKILKHIPIVLTVHNFRYQGSIDFSLLPPKDKDKGKLKLRPLFDPLVARQNPLLRAILHTDWINTVSPTHSLEVLSSQYGEGLEKILEKRTGTVTGIINGLDTIAFDPAKDPLIKQNYTLDTLDKRSLNKLELQKIFQLKQDLNIPLFAFSGRLDKQKGIQYILEIIADVLSETNAQFIFLGGGDLQIGNEIRLLRDQHPDFVGCHLYPNFQLPRKIFAGADMMLIPSVFEPGGIIALEALRYGCVPIVRRTGGLNDIITDFDPTSKKGNGFSFKQPQSIALLVAIIRALETYKNKPLWRKLVANAMVTDFSWDASSKEYLTLYKKALRIRKEASAPNPHPAFSTT